MRKAWFIALWAVCAPVARAADEADLPLDAILAGAARYADAYEKEFAYLVAEERYTQKLTRGPEMRGYREIRSDIAFVPMPTALRWTAFRDVYEVDGKPIADRRALLHKLFVDPTSNAVQRAADVLNTSARFNLGSALRNVNIPTLALVFLHGTNQPRFAFEARGRRPRDGVEAWEIAFEESASPTFVRDPKGGRDLRSRGSIWLDREGRVVRSEIVLGEGSVRADVQTRFAPWSGAAIWMPISMDDSYIAGGDTARPGRGGGPPLERMEGSARYDHFRRYRVHVESEVTTK